MRFTCAMTRRLLSALLAATALLAAPASAAEARFRVLVFSATEGFRHDSIPAGVAAIRALGARHGFCGRRDGGRRGVHRTGGSGATPPWSG